MMMQETGAEGFENGHQTSWGKSFHAVRIVH